MIGCGDRGVQPAIRHESKWLTNSHMTDKQKAIQIVKTQKSITPALLANRVWRNIWVPFSIDRRCRELKDAGYLKAKTHKKGYRTWVPTSKFKQLIKK